LDNKNVLNSILHPGILSYPLSLGTNNTSSTSAFMSTSNFVSEKVLTGKQKTFCVYFSVRNCLGDYYTHHFAPAQWTAATLFARKVLKTLLIGIFCAEDEGGIIWG